LRLLSALTRKYRDFWCYSSAVWASPCRLLVAVAASVVLCIPSTSDAGRITRLTQILKHDPSYKVRLQVAITLGKLRDRRAVPALLGALNDANTTVRAVAAGALGQIGDASAKPALQTLARKTRNAFVRQQARKALAKLSSATSAHVGRIYLTIGKIANNTSRGGPELSDVLGRALLSQFSRVDGVLATHRNRMPSPKTLKRRRIKAFVLDGAITSLSHQRRGSEVEISCGVRVSLATYPQNSMKAFYTGGASMAVSASTFAATSAVGLYRELVEGAAEGARRHIVQSYLRMQ